MAELLGAGYGVFTHIPRAWKRGRWLFNGLADRTPESEIFRPMGGMKVEWNETRYLDRDGYGAEEMLLVRREKERVNRVKTRRSNRES